MGRTNLPSSLTLFVGRNSERTDLRPLLSSSRLVTLTGSGGVGKTRLALESAHDVIDAYPDGIWFVDLTLISDGDLIPDVAAEALGLKELPFQERQDQLLNALMGSSCLILLDNCEHVITASAIFVDELLRACPQVALLATSREPLGVAGEVTFQVPPLSLPPEGWDTTLQEASGFDSFQLFVNRAQLADPHLALDDLDIPTVVGICRRLDGVPLALELAAARVRSLNLDEIATGLDERFQLLTGGPRTVLSRQQTLLASVEWSHGLLDPEQRAVFRRLGAFVGYFSAAAAHAVCSADDGSEDVAEIFRSLVERSLVQVERTRGGAPYRLLETLREFAVRKLEEAEEVHFTRDRHLDHYASIVTSLEGSLRGPELQSSAELLANEHDNLRSALDWGALHHPQKALRMTAALSIYWFARGHWSEARQRAAVALEARDVDPEVRGSALAEVALIAAAALDAPTAVTYGEAALDLGRMIDSPSVVTSALSALGSVYAFIDPVRARPLIEEATEISKEAGLGYGYMRAQMTAAIVEAQCGELKTARDMFETATVSARDAGIDLVLIPNRLWLSWTCAMQGDLDDARSVANEGVEICRRLANPQFEGYLTSVLSWIAASSGDHERARDLGEEARDMAERLADPAGLVGALGALTAVALAEGNLDQVERHLDESIPLSDAIGPRWAYASALVTKSELQRCRGAVGEAASTARTAREVAHGMSNRWMESVARVTEARALLEDRELETATRLLQEALPTLTDLDAKPDLVGALNTLGGVAVTAESWEDAVRLFHSAEELCERTAYVPPVPHTEDRERLLAAVSSNLDESSLERVRRDAVEADVEGVIAHVTRGWGPRSRPRSGWASLTPTEVKVVELVAEGLTNPQIGERMFISRRTVQTHLTHVFAKLGITSRSELAAEAARRGAVR